MKISNRAIPVTILSGFLGSGKTTLLNTILQSQSATNYKFLVIVNDFGDISLDDKIIVNDDIITFPNGCVCCSLGENFVESLFDLLKKEIQFDHIIIEASGISNPSNISEVVYMMPNLELSSVFTLIDSSNFLIKNNDVRLKNTIENQLKGATHLIMNKCDLSSEKEIEEINKWLLANQYQLPVYNTVNAHIPIDFFINPPKTSNSLKLQSENNHDFFKTITIKTKQAFHKNELIHELKKIPTNDVLRIKGMINLYEDLSKSYILNKIDQHIEISLAEKSSHSNNKERWITFISHVEAPDYNLDFFKCNN